VISTSQLCGNLPDEPLPMWIRHLFAIAVLPFTVTVLIPFWLPERYGTGIVVADNTLGLLIQLVGLMSFGTGLCLFTASFLRFATEGQGTLAPWDPPRRLVVAGPYRYVRNRMIAGVVFILLGEALTLPSAAHLTWAVAFVTVNLLYIPLVEEPRLRTRFGEPYIEYCQHVPPGASARSSLGSSQILVWLAAALRGECRHGPTGSVVRYWKPYNSSRSKARAFSEKLLRPVRVYRVVGGARCSPHVRPV
jgi:protein-S-isoprenylcysteine O-methyltransferase Ste14